MPALPDGSAAKPAGLDAGEVEVNTRYAMEGDLLAEMFPEFERKHLEAIRVWALLASKLPEENLRLLWRDVRPRYKTAQVA